MSKIKILIADDDEHIAELLSLYLNKEGYETREIYNGENLISEFSLFSPHLVILDIMMPGLDGYQACQEIRKISTVPIIMLTAKGEIFDKVLGLELGADDYMVKPFDTKELLARVKAVLRRNETKNISNNNTQIVVPNMTINSSNYVVIYHGEQLELPPKEFELLNFLAQNQNQVFTREQLLDKIWGYEFVGDTRTIDVHVKRIREKMPYEDTWSIKTVWGVGYKFENN